MAGVVDVSRRLVSDALSASNAILLPELLTEGKDDFFVELSLWTPLRASIFSMESDGSKSMKRAALAVVVTKTMSAGRVIKVDWWP